MAQQVIYTDDLDGKRDARTVTFSLDGHDWEIDLREVNERVFRKTLAPYVDAARRCTPNGAGKRSRATRSTTRSTPSPSQSGSNGHGAASNTDVRAWALANGHDVKPRGRVPAGIVAEYRAAMGSDAVLTT